MDHKTKKALGIVLKLLVWALMIAVVVLAFAKPEHRRTTEVMSAVTIMLSILAYSKDKGLAVLGVLILAIIYVTAM